MYYATIQISRFCVSAHISRAWKRIGPSALSGEILEPGIYFHVLCPTPKSAAFAHLGTSPVPYGLSEELKFNSAFTKSKSSIIIK
jgi:hypothetical protein